MEVAVEEGAGVDEVLFGVGFGGGKALKRCVEDADDPLLLGEGGERNGKVFKMAASKRLDRSTYGDARKIIRAVMEKVIKKPNIEVWKKIKERVCALV